MTAKSRTVFQLGNKWVEVKGAGPLDIIFSGEDPNIQSINITRLWRAIMDGKVKAEALYALFDRDNVRIMLADRDIDPKRVEQIKSDHELYNQPVLFAGTLPDVILIDGTHRVYARYMGKEDGVRCFVVSYAALEPFRVSYWLNGERLIETREVVRSTYEHPEPKLD